MRLFSAAQPLISVIVPCYNYGRFLPEALASIRQQNYPGVEVVVVDDGSTDDTRRVAAANPAMRYVYQPNQGLSAARNAGVARSRGQYLVFLDADDWLLPQALAINAWFLKQYPALAFVSGGHIKVVAGTNYISSHTQEVGAEHYVHLLQGNYIGMPAALMFRRWVFNAFCFDTSLHACEDYDLCLRVARRYPVAHHTRPVAAYRQHGSNMSGDADLMLTTVLQVLERQRPWLRNEAEATAYQKGREAWQAYYNRLSALGIGV